MFMRALPSKNEFRFQIGRGIDHEIEFHAWINWRTWALPFGLAYDWMRPGVTLMIGPVSMTIRKTF